MSPIESLINSSYGAERFFISMGMFFYAELIREMRKEIMKIWKAVA